jgi:acyl carrier protein
VTPLEQELTEVFRNVFEDPSLSITSKTTARDIPSWDSLMHIQLVVAIEKKFGVSFSAGEIERLQTVGDMLKLLEVKIAKR